MAFFMDGKTDKQLVWEALKHLEHHTSEVGRYFDLFPETIWKDWSVADRLRIRGILLTNGLVTVFEQSQWAFQLTVAGMVLKETDLKEDGFVKKKNPYKQFWLGVIAALIGAVISTSLSAMLEVWKANNLPTPQSKTIVLPKIRIIHDTVFQKKTLPKKP